MKYYCLFLGLLLIASCNRKENASENEFGQVLETKLLDPIAVDSLAAPFGFKPIDFYMTDLRLKFSAKGYKTYSNIGFGEDFIVRGKDTLRLEYDVAFNKDNLIQRIESSKTRNEYFYDKHNNLVLRRFMSKTKEDNSTVDQFTYDHHGNLMSFYRYGIKPDGTYEFWHYKKYFYSESKEGITVTIKGIEKWTDFHKLNVIKKFDKDKKILSEVKQDYNPLSAKDVSHVKEYKHVKINNRYYVSEEKAYMSYKPEETITKSYEYNDEGRESVIKTIESMTNYELEYTITKEYANHNLRQSVSSAASNDEKRIEIYPAKKNGLQETYTYSYNLRNDMIKQKHTIHSGKKEDITVTENIFQYDDQGNWNYRKQTVEYPYVKYADDGYDDGGDDALISVRKMDYSKNDTLSAIPKADPKAELLKKETSKKYPLQEL